MMRIVLAALACLGFASCGSHASRMSPPTALSAECATVLQSCGRAAGLACVSLRYSTYSTCRDSVCHENVAALLRANGVTVRVAVGPPLPAFSGRPGCIGTRDDITGTAQEAACLAQVLGSGYRVAKKGCNGDGFPHAVFVR